MFNIYIKRVYDGESENDGYRILVDKLWPRGFKKEDLKLDLWAKDITPSTEIRKKFGHNSENFEQFKISYIEELQNNSKSKEFVSFCRDILKSENITFLYAAKNREYNHAIVLKDWILEKLN